MSRGAGVAVRKAAPPVAAAGAEGRPRVLAVGDLPAWRGRLLRRELDVTRAIETSEAARLLESTRPEAVLLDAGLPASDLRAITRTFADDESRPAVLMVTARGQRRRVPERPAAVDDMVSGALGERELVSRVRSALRVRGWMSELSRKNAELQSLYRHLEELAGRMAQELKLAASVQRSLLPPPLQHPRLEVAKEFLPVREIGGDYYDFIPLGADRLAFAIGDVMGKGVPAALLAANLKALMRAQVQAGDLCPEALVARVNRLFWEVVPNGLFSSLFYGVFDLEESRLDFVNAGHHYPFLVQPDGTVHDLVEGGTVLGLVEDSEYEKGQVRISRDDLLVFFSDGVTDRTSPEGELYGVDRLKEAAVRSRRDSARIVLYTLLGEIQGWSGGSPAEDDTTLVVAKAR
jgi:serine phosphatase RsbU (regulator of sigma subunit)